MCLHHRAPHLHVLFDDSCAALREAVMDSREERMLRTKLWLEIHVAIDTTARLMSDATRMSNANCSRIGTRIFGIRIGPQVFQRDR